MPQLGPCQTCAFWFDASHLPMGYERNSSTQCRRRVVLDHSQRQPYQPRTTHNVTCGEYAPPSELARVPRSCGDCVYWIADERETKPGESLGDGPEDVGKCHVKAPVPNAQGMGHLFTRTARGFFCGDGRPITAACSRAAPPPPPAASPEPEPETALLLRR